MKEIERDLGKIKYEWVDERISDGTRIRQTRQRKDHAFLGNETKVGLRN